MTDSAETSMEKRGAAALWPGALWLGLAVAAGLALHYEGLIYLWNGWGRPEFSHGPLIPVISGYLFLRHLKSLPPNPDPIDDRWPGLALLALVSLFALLSNIIQIEVFVAAAIVPWVGALILLSFGWRRGRRLWPPVLHLGFMLPLPFFTFWQVSTAMQLMSSELGVRFIMLAGVPVYLDGNIIDLGVYKLHVAEACSGLRYLYPVFSFTYIFAVLYRGPFWLKGLLLLAAAPLTIAMNAFRIAVIGVLVDLYGIEMAEGFLHFFEGWVIFIACIVIMIGLAKTLQLLSGDRRPLSAALDVDTTGIGRQLARIGDVAPSKALLGSTLVIALAAASWSPFARPAAEQIEREPFTLFPDAVGDWRLVERRGLDDEIRQILKADDFLSAALVGRGEAAPVDLFVAWYLDPTTGSIHSPEICLPGGGWEMSKIERREIMLDFDGRPQPLAVNRALIQKGLERQLVYYWFDQSGRRLTSDLAVKFYIIWDSFFTGRRDGALLRYVTPIGKGEPVEQAEDRLRRAINATAPEMPRFMQTNFSRAQ